MAVAALYTRPSRWLRDLFRRKPQVESLDLRDYRLAVTPLLERAECLYQQWREQMETAVDSERIANIASTQSWEMASLGSRLDACTPPEGLEGLHRGCVKSFQLARRAGQLLSTGYRYHNSDALCDGHATLDDARRLYLSALAEFADLASLPERVES
jgi:hypothetical protein